MSNSLKYHRWLTRVKHALVAAGVFKIPNYIWSINLCEKSWKHYFDDGFTPIEAVLDDIKNQ